MPVAYPYAFDLLPDGIKTVFTLASAPDPNSLLVLWNGQVQRGSYTLTGQTLSLSFTPMASDSLAVYYTAAYNAALSGPPGGISFDPEVIANALFIRLGQISYAFKTMDRKGKIWTNVTPADQPYIGLIERGGMVVQNQAIGLTKHTLHFLILVYIRGDASQDPTAILPATLLNAVWKGIEQIMNSSPMGERQTLGGIVNNAWIEGEVVMDTGILDQQLALMVPVSIDCGI